MSARNIIGSTFVNYKHSKEVITLSSFDINTNQGKSFFGKRFKKAFKYTIFSKFIRLVYRIHSSHYTNYYLKRNKRIYDLETLHLIKEKLKLGTSNYILDDYKLAFSIIFNFLSNKHFFKFAEKLYFFLYLIFSLKYLFIFLRYKPSKVFFCHAHASQDKSILFLCKFLKVKNECLIHSWDNPTSKLLIPFKFDKVYCWNSIIKKELINIYSYLKKDVKEIGIPQFDYYSNFLKINKKSFAKKLFQNDRRYLISFFCPSPAFVKHQQKIVDDLISIVGKHKDFNLFIRLHPGNKPKWTMNKKYKKHNLIINQPSSFYLADIANLSEFSKVNDEQFISILKCSDITINCFSTTSIDSIYFNTPNISIGYDNKKTKNFYDKIDFYYKWKHYDEILKTKSISIATNKKNLKELIFKYLKNKNYKSKERIKTKKSFIHNLNSNSGYLLARNVFQ
jgi:hypothetical protein